MKLEFNKLILDTDLRLCTVEGNEISLTNFEYKLLLFLISNVNKVFNRKEIMMEVWKTKVSNHTIDVAISRLRKKLGKSSKHIITRLGFGYGFVK